MNNPLDHLNWGNQKKLQSREETIIFPYYNHIGKCLPDNSQYWTICSRQYNEEGNLAEGCELDQMIKCGLISPRQFHGVDIDKEVIEGNQKLPLDTHWYNADFYTTMVNAYNDGVFQPGIVNYDSISMPERGSVEFAKIMYLLSLMPNLDKCLLVGNFILRQRCVEKPIDTIVKELEDQPKFKASFHKKDWKWNQKLYIYNGSGQTKATWMGSLVMWI